MFYAHLDHYTINQTPLMPVGETLAAAKRNSTKALGDGFRDHSITIVNESRIALFTRKMTDKKWRMI